MKLLNLRYKIIVRELYENKSVDFYLNVVSCPISDYAYQTDNQLYEKLLEKHVR